MSEGDVTGGTRVWVTRDEGADGPLSSALRALGRAVVLEPVLRAEPLMEAEELREDLARLGARDWLVLTSARAVEALPVDAAPTARVAVVGPATRAAAEALGLAVAAESPDGTGAALWLAIADQLVGARVFFPRSEQAAVPTLPGTELIAPAVYGMRPRRFDATVVERVDAVTVASPTAAIQVAELVRSKDLIVASIGPTTTRALSELGLEDVREAVRPTFESLAEST